MKHFSAIVAAVLITTVVGLGIFVIGANALTNKNIVPLQNTPTSSTGNNSNAVPISTTTTNVQQLQQEVTQLQSQLNQDNQALQQYQSLLVVLQQRGLISVDSNGNITIRQGGFDDFH